jgi:phosphoribosylanthranilate isomerase
VGVAVKICGVRDAATVAASLDAGADWVGIVLAPSPRQVTLDAARHLTRAFPGRLIAVVRGVADDVFQALWDLPWGGFQVYDRPAATWVPEATARGWLTVQPGCREDQRGSAAVLLLEGEPGRGQRFDWDGVDRPRDPFWVAGGLTPENVGMALRYFRPAGVDVSSGVETAPGVKDVHRIRRFIEEVRRWER